MEARQAGRRFIKRAMKAPLLEREHERDLARRWRDRRDEAALHELVTAYVRLVVATAARFRNHSLPMGDMVNIIGRRVADSFALGLRLSAPFVIVGLTYYIGLGLLGRLMPQLQVFFFGLPVQIGLQIWVLSITISGIMLVFLQEFEEAYQGFTLP